MPQARARLIVVAAAGLVLALPLATQKVPLITLAKPLVEHPEPLTQPVSIRELADGRVLVTDMEERRLLLYDFVAKTAAPAARQGAGPLEFQMPGQLFAIGDSTLMPDIMQRRFLFLGPNGAPLRTQSILQANDDILAVVRAGNIFAIDARGQFYSEARAFVIKEGQMPTTSDTVALVRWAKFGVKGETLATKYDKAPMPKMSGTAASSIKMRMPIVPYVTRDLWQVFPNGRVVVLRASDYHSEFIDPDGARRTGPSVPYVPVPVTAADRERLRKTTRETYERAMKLGMSMARSSSAQPLPKIAFDLDEPAEWPKFKPPFANIFVAPDDFLWVATSAAGAEDIVTYDVLNAKGALVKRVRFPKNVVLLGFGRNALYATRKDEDDLRYLQRYSVP
ncbi:MAG: hypothetical protein ABI877_08245 [Gemmatimonadaceae bacterium]